MTRGRFSKQKEEQQKHRMGKRCDANKESKHKGRSTTEVFYGCKDRKGYKDE
jgi:hypothetical protein